MTEIGKAHVGVVFDQNQISQGIAATKGGVLSKFGGIGKLGGAALAAGVAVGAIAAGKALFGVGQTFRDVSDTIRVGTGATGGALRNLVGDAKAVGKQVPANFQDIATAIADLNTRTGQSGKPLQALATQFLNLQRITGEELSTSIPAVTRLFGDWSIKTEDQAATMDKLFRASQSTGIGVTRLSELMVQFGSPLRQLGLGFDFSAAMFSRFEKEGVNIQTAMPGLRMALKNFAKDGKEPASALMETFKAIRDTSSTAKANTLAFKVFGVRAGPDLAAAIREGRFDLDELMGTIRNGKDTINTAAKDTQSFGESWQILKNKALVFIEPLATKLFNAFSVGMAFLADKGIPTIERLATQAGQFLGPAFAQIGALIKNDLIPAFQAIMPIVAPVASFLIKVVGGAIVGAFKGAIQAISGALNVIKGVFEIFAGLFTGDWGRLWNGVKQVFSGIWNTIVGLVKFFWNVGILNVFRKAAAFLLKGIWVKLWTGIKSVAVGAFNAVKGFIGRVLASIRGFFTGAWNAIRSATRTAWNAFVKLIKEAMISARTRVGAILAGIRTAIANAWNFVKSATRGAWNNMVAAVRSGVSRVIDFVRSIPGKIVRGLGNLGSALFSAGKNLILGFIRGIGSMVSGLRDAIVGLLPGPLKKFAAKLGLASPSTLFREHGRNTVRGFILGLEDMSDRVTPALQSVVDLPALSAVGGDGASASGGVGAGIFVEQLNVQALSDQFRLRQVHDELAMHGVA